VEKHVRKLVVEAIAKECHLDPQRQATNLLLTIGDILLREHRDETKKWKGNAQDVDVGSLEAMTKGKSVRTIAALLDVRYAFFMFHLLYPNLWCLLVVSYIYSHSSSGFFEESRRRVRRSHGLRIWLEGITF